jgi:hypothetical protein
MNELLLPFAVWMQVSFDEVGRRARAAWAELTEDDGVDEAVTKMIWLAAGIIVALAATAFFTTKFNQAKTRVPDPLVP